MHDSDVGFQIAPTGSFLVMFILPTTAFFTPDGYSAEITTLLTLGSLNSINWNSHILSSLQCFLDTFLFYYGSPTCSIGVMTSYSDSLLTFMTPSMTSSRISSIAGVYTCVCEVTPMRWMLGWVHRMFEAAENLPLRWWWCVEKGCERIFQFRYTNNTDIAITNLN